MIFCSALVAIDIAELSLPLKKRRSRYMKAAAASDHHLLRPPTPLTLPLPPPLAVSLPQLLPTPCGFSLPTGLTCSPMASLLASRCSRLLQFEVRKTIPISQFNVVTDVRPVNQ